MRDPQFNATAHYLRQKKAILEAIVALIILVLLCALLVLFSPQARGDETPARSKIDSPVPKIDGYLYTPIQSGSPKPVLRIHAFYGPKAKIVLGIEGTAAALDMGQTCHNLARGGREVNLPSQNCAALVAMTVGFIAAGEGIAYFLHRIGHHKLEQLPRAYLLYGSIEGMIISKQHGAW